MRPIAHLVLCVCLLVFLCSCVPPAGGIGEPYIITEADYRLAVSLGDDQPEVTAELTLRCNRADQRIAILPRSVALLDWQAGQARIIAGPESYILQVPRPGTYHVRMRFLAARRQPSISVEEVDLPGLPANRSEMTVRLPAGTGEFSTRPQGIVTSDTTRGDRRQIRLLPPPARTITLRWHKSAAAAVAEASVLVSSDSVLRVRRGLVVRDTRLSCAVQQGAIDSLAITAPPGVTVRSVTGRDILSWSFQNDGRTIAVRFDRKIKGRTQVRLRSEEILPALPGPYSYLPITVAAARAHEGTIRLLPAAELVLTETSAVGATRSGDGLARRTALGYSFARLPVKVELQVAEREPRLAVVTETLATIEAGLLTLHSRLAYDIQMRAVRGLSIGIPEGATVLEVSGAAVRDWEVADGRNLKVRFDKARMGPVKLAVRLQQNLQKINGFVIPRLQPSGVAQEEGVIGVSAGEGVQLRHHRAALTEQIDVGQLPKWLREGGARLGYRYRRPGGTLAVLTEKIRPRVTAAIIDKVILEQDLLLRTVQVALKIEQAEVFEISLRIPAELTPLRVTGPAVAGW
ncbi:MAG: hypothetical protein GWP05_10625, partial [Anaerolineaceae bacterium]|nr:hypothetical protein [Anaerolineaceae bacterium]